MTENIFNKPINGEINQRRTTRVAQADPQELADALEAVFALPQVEAIKWEQHTPYFNDGDPCEFGVNEARFKFTGVDEEEGDYEDGFITIWYLTYKGSNGTYPYRPEGAPEFTDEELEVIRAASVAIEGGAHEDFLEDTFGDPAAVTATREGFDVEYYEHD